jgi:hypothetical protein
MCVLCALTLVLLVLSTQSLAQGYGSIAGTVADPTGAVVASATVTVTQTDTGRKTVVTSGPNGAFVFPALAPTDYMLTVAAKGFQNYMQSGVVLQADQSLTVRVRLELGAATQTIQVTTEVPQIDTTSGTLSQVIDESRVVDLPLNGRNAAQLVTLVAGVIDATNEGNGVNQGNGKTFPAAVVTSANGTLPNQSNYLLNGGNNVDEMTNVNGPFPFPDALQEFSVQTSNYNAEFGQSAGAVVNIVTKSGGKKFHGDLFEFLRNGYFNAKPYFATVADNYHRHQFGGTIGGPVIIPHFSTGARTQFFFGYQHTLYHANSSATSTTVPTLAEEGLSPTGAPLAYADYSNLCNTASGNSFNTSGMCVTSAGVAVPAQQISNPFTGVAYPNNHVPASAFDPASVAFEKVFPTFSGVEAAGKIGGAVSYFQPTTQFFDEYIARVDHAFSDKDHLFGHYYSDYFDQAPDYNPAMLSSYRSYFNTRYQNVLLSETHTFTNSLLNNLIVNYQREVALRGGPPGSTYMTDFGVKNIWQPATGPYMQTQITGYFSAASSAFAAWSRNNYTLNDDLHWTKGSHNFAFGGHIELSKFDVTNVYQSYGAFGFSTTTQNPNAMANYQMGFMTSFLQGNYEQVNDRNHFPGLYAQDSWKITPRLTFNYGVRWEDFAPWANNVGNMQEFSASAYAANQKTTVFSTLPAGMLLTGDPGVPKNSVKSKYAQFMPRAGFAYDIFGDGKTVVRGGAGIFYQDRLPGFFNLSQASWVPNNQTVTLANDGMYSTTAGANPGGPFSDPYCTTTAVCAAAGDKVTNLFPYTLPFKSTQTFNNGITLDEYDPSGNFQVPVTNDFNLTVERQLFTSWALRVAYVGSTSRHQFVSVELNPSVNLTGLTGASLGVNQRRVYNTAPTVGPCTTITGCNANYSDIIDAAMIGNAHYNSFQGTLEKKMSHGLSVLANYSWSKSFDDMPQATRVSNTEDLNSGDSYVYPLYPAAATNIPAAAYVPDIKVLDRGLSDIDHPSALSVSYVYALPKLHQGARALQAVANGWRTSGLFQHHSGDVLTTYMGAVDNSLTNLFQDRAQRDFTQSAYSFVPGGGNCTAGKSCITWLNKAAFSVPAKAGAGTGFGNVIKGTLRGPAYTNWDAAVVRTFPVFSATTVEFRAEYFNVLNHTKLGNPQTTESNAAFGTITASNPSTDAERIAQFSLKYVF